jgi:spore germination protein KC
MKKLFFIIAPLILLVTGCWNYRELNEMAIVGALGIDYDEKKDMFIMTAQIFNAKKTSTNGSSSSGEQSPITIYEKEGRTVHEALRNMIYDSPKKLYIGHLDIVIFGEAYVKKGFISGGDFLFRDNESRQDFNILMTKEGKASDVLKILTPLISVPSISVRKNILANAEHIGTSLELTYDSLLSDYYTQGIEPVIPIISIKGDKQKGESTEITKSSVPSTKLIINTIGLFKNDKYIGSLSEKESYGYNLIVGNVKGNVTSFKCDEKNNYTSIEITGTKSKIKGIVKKNKPTVEINIMVNGGISEYNCDLNLKLPKNIHKVEDMAKKHLEKIVKKTINTVQKKYNSDIFGFGEGFFSNNYKYWKKEGKKWDELFPNLEYKININVNLIKKGSVITSTKGGKKLGR